MNAKSVATYYVAPFVAVLLASVLPVGADEMPNPPRTTPPIVAFVDTSKPFCFARTYDAAHMKAHPKQKVTAIAFTYFPEQIVPDQTEPVPMWDPYNERPSFTALIAVTTLDYTQAKLSSVYCSQNDNDSMECGIEDDGGLFVLRRKAAGKIMMELNTSLGMGDRDSTSPQGVDWDIINRDDDQAAFLMEAAGGGLCDVRQVKAP